MQHELRWFKLPWQSQGKHQVAFCHAGDWHCHECRAARKAAAKTAKPATSTEAVLSEPEAEPQTAAKPARRLPSVPYLSSTRAFSMTPFTVS